MKKYTWRTVLIALILVLGTIASVHAEIIPAHGEGQIGLEAVVLCEELTLRVKPRTSAKAVKILKYQSLIIVTEELDGWAHVVLGDSEDSPSGWVKSDYLMIDPAWYRTEAKTSVYAWNDTSAPKVALLDKDTTLPILKEDGKWLVVSLRGAAGWIRK